MGESLRGHKSLEAASEKLMVCLTVENQVWSRLVGLTGLVAGYNLNTRTKKKKKGGTRRLTKRIC